MQPHASHSKLSPSSIGAPLDRIIRACDSRRMNDHLAPTPLEHRRHSNDACIALDRSTMVLIVPRGLNPAMTLVFASTPHGNIPLPTRYYAVRVGLERVHKSSTNKGITATQNLETEFRFGQTLNKFLTSTMAVARRPRVRRKVLARE